MPALLPYSVDVRNTQQANESEINTCTHYYYSNLSLRFYVPVSKSPFELQVFLPPDIESVAD